MLSMLKSTAIGRAVYLILISMLPIIELRGGIPVGIFECAMPWYQAYAICVIGNMIPVPFVILFGKQVIKLLKKVKYISGFVEKYENRVQKKAEEIKKYVIWGLFIFVAIPMPATGAWTGAAIAAILNMKIKDAILPIFLGVLTAGAIITLGSGAVLGTIRLIG